MRRSIQLSGAAILAVLLFCFFAVGYVPLCQRTAREELRARIGTVEIMSVRPLARALAIRDDLALVAQIETITRIDDIETAYILDSSGTVIVHSLTAEWGRSFTDHLSRSGMGRQRVQRSPSGFLFSVPLNADATLFITVSDKALQARDSASVRAALLIGLIMFIMVAAAGAAVLTMAVFKPFSAVSEALNDPLGYHPPAGLRGEWASLSEKISALACQRTVASSVPPPEGKRTDDELLSAMVDHDTRGVLAIDAQNRVIAVNDEFRSAFEGISGCVPGSHILDMHVPAALLDLVQSAAATTGKEVSAVIGALNVHALKIQNAGLIVWCSIKK